MDFLDAFPLVLGSYASYGLIHRRMRLILGKHRGAERVAFRIYPHHALVAALPCESLTPPGPLLLEPPLSPHLGKMPEPWASSRWFREDPGALREARDLLLAGAASRAATLAKDHGQEVMEELFTWAVLLRVWAEQWEAAEEASLALGESLPKSEPRARRLLAMIETRRAEGQRGRLAFEAAERADAYLDLVGPSLWETPAWSALPAHVALLRLSIPRLELSLFEARRKLRRALAHHPEAPCLYLVRAHLAISLGDVSQAADHLAKALYHGQGDPFYARPILGVRSIGESRPALAAQARTLSENVGVDTREAADLESGSSHRDPRE